MGGFEKESQTLVSAMLGSAERGHGWFSPHHSLSH